MPRASVRRLSLAALWRVLLVLALIAASFAAGRVSAPTGPSAPVTTAPTTFPAPLLTPAFGPAFTGHYPDLMGGGAYTPDIAPVAVTTTQSLGTVPPSLLGVNVVPQYDPNILDSATTSAMSQAGIKVFRWPGGFPGLIYHWQANCWTNKDNTPTRCADTGMPNEYGADNPQNTLDAQPFSSFMSMVKAAGGKAVIEVNTLNNYTGQSSMLNTATPHTGLWDAQLLNDGAAVWQPATGVVSGTTYVTSVWARGTTGGTARLRLYENDTNNAILGDQTFTLTSSWQQYSITALAGANGLRPNIAAIGNGGVFIDDAAVTAQGSSSNLLTNPGFDATSSRTGKVGTFDGWNQFGGNSNADPQETAGWVTHEIQNGDAPYILNFGLGNEDYNQSGSHSAAYPSIAHTLAQAMQAAATAQNTTIHIAVDAWDAVNYFEGGAGDTYTVNALSATCGDSMVDTMDNHFYTGASLDSNLLRTNPTEEVWRAPVYDMPGRVAKLKANIASACPAKSATMGIVSGEFNSDGSHGEAPQNSSLVNALFTADNISLLATHGVSSVMFFDQHDGTRYNQPTTGNFGNGLYGAGTTTGSWGMLSLTPGYNGEGFGATGPTIPGANYAYPAYHAYSLLNSVYGAGGTMVAASSPASALSSYATLATDGSIRALLVNRSSSVTFTVPLAVAGANGTPFAGNGYLQTRSYGPAQSAAGPAPVGPNAAAPVSTTTPYSGQPVVTLPAYTIAAVTLYPASAAVPATSTPVVPTATPIQSSTPTPGPTVGNAATAPQAPLSGLYNAVGIVADGTTFTGASAVDGCCANYSSNALTAAGFTLGGTFSYGGATFTTPPTTGNNALTFAGQTVSFGGYVAGARLSLLGFATGGDKTDTVTLHYADGTSAPATLTIPDWTSTAAPPTGVSVAVQTTYRVSTNGTQDTGSKPRVYNIDLPIAKSLASFTLPTNSGLHLLAATVNTTAYPATATPTAINTPTGTPVPTNTPDANGFTNALQNNGFEFGSFAGWDTVTNATVTTTAPHAGTYAASFPATGGSVAQNAGSLTSGLAYNAGAWVKVATAGDCVTLIVTGFNGHLGQAGSCFYPLVNTWTYIAVPFVTGGTDTNALVTISAPATNGGATYVDDTAVLLATAPQAATPYPSMAPLTVLINTTTRAPVVVMTGQTETITVTLATTTGAQVTGATLSCAITGPAGQAVTTVTTPNLTIPAGAPTTFTATWVVPAGSPLGVYTVQPSVLSAAGARISN